MDRYDFHLLPEPLITEQLPDGGEASYHLELDGKRLVVTEVRVRQPSPHGVSSRDMRDRRPKAALQAFEAALRDVVNEPPEPDAEGDRQRRKELGDRLLADPKRADHWRQVAEAWVSEAERWAPVYARLRGKAFLPTERIRRLALTAALYVDAVAHGDRSPNQTVGRKQRRSPNLVRDDLKRARDAGLLTNSGGRGMAGGDLTPKAWAIIEKETDK